MKKKFLSITVILSILCTMFCTISVSAMTENDFVNKISELQRTFVDGQYWNYYSSSDYSRTGYQKCKCTGTYCKGDCSCSCGQFYHNGKWYGGQCHGYALKLGYLIFGSVATDSWSKHYNAYDVYAGDLVRIDGNNHSIFVYKVDGNTIYYTDCNSSAPCQVKWGKTISKSALASRLTYVLHNPSYKMTGTGTAQTTINPIHSNNNANVRDGFFTLKNVASGSFMNVYDGIDANKTKITMWQYDDSTDQQFNIVHKGNGKYKLYAVASSKGTNRVVDVYRGTSAPAEGQVIDLWTPDDDTSQLFYIVPLNDGSYVFELAAKDGYVIAPANNSAAGQDGSQLILQRYTGANHQKWKFCNNNGKETYPVGSYSVDTYSVDTNGVILNMRNSASTSGSVVTKIPDKAILNITKVSGNWGYTTYNGYSGWVCLDFMVYKPTITSISVYSAPYITKYFVGEQLNLSGLELTATYSNGSTQRITSGYTATGDLSTEGTKTITVKYSGKSTSFNVSVLKKQPMNLSIKTKPNKLNYYVGSSLDTTGLVLSVTYNDGTTQTVSSGFTTSCDLSTSGTKTVTVNYGGKSTTYTVTVQDVKISNLALKTKPTKTAYYVGDTIDTSGLELTATYNNGSTKTITSGFTTSYDFGTAGTKKVTVNYSGLSVTYDVTVENIGSASLETSLTSTAVKGSEVIYTVDLKSAENIYDGNYNIIYDNTVLKYKSHTVGTVLTGQNCVVNPEYSENSIRTTFAGTSALKTGNMLSITFEVVADTETTTQVKTQNVNMYNQKGKNISVSETGLTANCNISKKVPETVAIPTANVNEGAVENGSTITLSTTTVGADIYYTVDGSVPTTSSLKYTEPIKITGEVTIKAIAVKSGMTNSSVATFAYTILDDNKTTFKLSTVNGRAGDTVEVTLDVTNKTNIAGIIFKLAYDEGITLTEITEGDALSGLTFTPPKNVSKNPCTLLWDGVDGDSTSGTLLKLKFTINEDSPEGDYNIKLTCNAGDIYDNDMNDIDVVIVNGKITVKDFTLGDLNDDGNVNAKDITLLRRYVSGDYNVTVNTNAADVNKDGNINAKDITLLRRYISGDYGIIFE